MAEGFAIPHGIYDLKLNTGYITIGISRNTSEFVCECLIDWWQTYGQSNYPGASSILLLCDSGGSNNARHYVFKEKLQLAVNKIGIEVRIAHFPPYTSKYNPIEHLLFPHITRTCQGVIFANIEMIKELMQKTATQTGLKVFVSINSKVYLAGKKASEGYRDNMAIIFDDYLPMWNYTAVPKNTSISPLYSLVSIEDNIQKTKEIMKRTIQTLEQNFPGIH